MTGGEQSGEGFRGEEDPEVGDEEVEQGEGQPAHLQIGVGEADQHHKMTMR